MHTFSRIRDFYYNCKNGIYNIFRWIPTIWQLRDWDAGFIYLLIYKQLSYVEDCLRNYGNSVNSTKYANQIRIAKNLIQRLWKDNYFNNALIPVEKKYGKLKTRIEPYKYDESGKVILHSMIFDETIKESKERTLAFKHAVYMREQDKNMLFLLLSKKIDNWLD
jgi:hypothetical protein